MLTKTEELRRVRAAVKATVRAIAATDPTNARVLRRLASRLEDQAGDLEYLTQFETKNA